MSISWFWYIYLVFFVVYGGWEYSLYLKEKVANFWGRIFFPVSLILCVYVLLDYFSIISLNTVPYLSLSLSGFTMVYLGYEYMSGCKELFKDSDDDEYESQEVSESTSHTKNSKYKLLSAVNDSGEGIINLDAYKKPVNPTELGGAIAKMFSNNPTVEELVDAAEIFNDASSPEYDDEYYLDAGMYTATVFAFIHSAPLVYVSYLLFIRELMSVIA